MHGGEPQHGTRLTGAGGEEQRSRLVVSGQLTAQGRIEREGGILGGELSEASLDPVEPGAVGHRGVGAHRRSSSTMTSWCDVWGNMSKRRARRVT